MNIQHTQQIQHVRHARDYRRDDRSAFTGSRRRRGRVVGVAAAAAAAFIATTTVGGSASAAHPSDDGPAASVARAAASPPTVSTPCFAGRMPDRWANDVGTAPRCTHTYGATGTVHAFTVRKPHGEAADMAEPVHVSVDHINGMYAAQVRAAQADAATAVSPSADWYEHQARAQQAAAVQPSTGDDQHWRTCFIRYGTFHAWEVAQTGMPRCDIYGGDVDPDFRIEAAPHPDVVDSPCFMNPDHWGVRFESSGPVCYPR